jgi:hypothetical protein
MRWSTKLAVRFIHVLLRVPGTGTLPGSLRVLARRRQVGFLFVNPKGRGMTIIEYDDCVLFRVKP